MRITNMTHDSMHSARNASTATAAFLFVFVLVISPLSTTWFAPNGARLVAARSRLPASVAPSGDDWTVPAPRGTPLIFIENVGQLDERAHFQVRSGRTTLFLTHDALWLSLTEPWSQPDPIPEAIMPGAVETGSKAGRQANLKLSFLGANPHPQLEPFDRLETQISFFSGNDPSEWHTNAPAWAGVRYADLYPGIDLEITSQNGQLDLRMVVRAPSALQGVRLQVEGADTLALEGNYLRLTTLLGDIALPLLTVDGTAPNIEPAISVVDEIYQVSAPFASISPSAIPATAPRSSPLLYSTYLGGSGDDQGRDIALDGEGNVYVVGQTSSTDLPTTPGAYDRLYNGGNYDVFVTKLSAEGSTLLYSTYLGGNDEDGGNNIVVDGAGNAYIIGATRSNDFPTTPGALDRTFNGGQDAFVAKLNAAGDGLVYSTYLGGSADQDGRCITLDDAGNAYVGGATYSGFPTTPGAAQTTHGGLIDGYAAKLSSDGSTLLYSTYLGGYSYDLIDGIALDNAGNAYVASHTHSTDFPTTPGAWDRVCDNCGTNYSTDGAVAKLNADGSQFIYSTLIGGTDAPAADLLRDIAVDNAGNAYLTGWTSSSDFPTTPNALQPGFGGGEYDAVAVKLNADGSDLLSSTYLGGSGTEAGHRIAIDDGDHAYITGYTTSTDLVTVNPLQAANAGGCDAFVVKVNTDGSALLYSTYLGGSGDENSLNPPHDFTGITVGPTGKVYLTGITSSLDFPTTATAYDLSFNGGASDIFVTSIDIFAGPSIHYAAPSAVGSGNCSTWTNACTLQTALATAVSGDEIWVQAGVHYPGAVVTNTFQLKNGVALYGGFASTESARDERDWHAHLTVLSGDIDRNDLTDPSGVVTRTVNITGANAYHVVVSSGTDATAVLDGFIITAGQAREDSISPHYYGGGILNWNYSNPTLNNVTFSGNTAGFGGGMFNWHSSPILTNVAFSGNSTLWGGGGMYNLYGSPTLTNVAFSGNSTLWDGAGMYNWYCSPTLTNVTFSGNSADSAGGGMTANGSTPMLTNVILWGNTAPNGAGIYNVSSTPTIAYSDIQGCGGSSSWASTCGTDGGGNIEADPLFVDADAVDDTPGTADDNLRLQLTSPAIDAGDNSVVPSGIVTDLHGKLRFVDIPFVPDTGNGTPPIVDMGACEAQQVVDAKLNKAVLPLAVAPGEHITFTLTLTNHSSITATGVVVTDTLPAWMENVSFTSTLSVTDTGHFSRYVWAVQDLKTGQSGVITVSGVLTVPLTAGTYTNTASIFAVGDLPTENNTAVITFTISNVPPAFTSVPVTTATQDALYTYTATAEDDNGDALTLTVPTLPAWLTLTDNGDGTATFSGAPGNNDVGQHLVVLRVTDNVGAFAEQEFVVTVSERPQYYIYLPLVLSKWSPQPKEPPSTDCS
ncbi:MAG: SBBP repeat-containing protein [Anaerolineae bacterium]|nr:SBBP repeat-containing protein [Anaerolineae bacterium]